MPTVSFLPKDTGMQRRGLPLHTCQKLMLASSLIQAHFVGLVRPYPCLPSDKRKAHPPTWKESRLHDDALPAWWVRVLDAGPGR